MADFARADLEEHRSEVRTWVAKNFPPSLKGAGFAGREPGALAPDHERWRVAVGAKGWGTPTWPRQYGGGGLSSAEARIIEQEFAAAGAYNPIGGLGVMMFGPTLLEYGDEAQKQTHIPPIARGELQWCQGFSEPGAGSDLASLQTRAEDRGDHFIVSGQKVWTSGAQTADWCFCLVRTDTTKKHEGISFVLFSMKTPGVEVRPIQLISGNSPFCETFLTEVRVPKENLVGPLNGGWTVAKRLLQHERQSISGGGRLAAAAKSLPEMAMEYVGLDAMGRIADSDLRARIIRNEMDARAFGQTTVRAMTEARSNQGPSAATSIMKNAGSTMFQERMELMLEVMGAQALGWDGEAFIDQELALVRSWLHGKATTIFGGSYEIQNNIISKRILGLPDLNKAG